MSETRIPKTEITGLSGAMAKRFTKRMLGDVPEQLEVMWHNKPVLMTMMGMSRKAKKWKECDEQLKAFAHMAVVSLVGCQFCLDLGYFMAHHDELDVVKAREVPAWRESSVFTPLERDVLEYAEAMSETPPTVTDDLSARLLTQLGAPALLELTAFTTLANMAARLNVAIRPLPVAGILGVMRPPSVGPAVVRDSGRVLAAMSAATRTASFEAHRRLLFAVAYEMLGSAVDAEDVVQESWLQWASVDRSDVRDVRAFLICIVTRQALNRMRTLARRREEYVGEWLPEPLLTTPDVADDVEFAESISIAMLTVLETLGPIERAVFVLREVFAVPYEEIAASLEKTSAAVRQIAHRAREHVESRRPRVRVTRAEQEEVVERFLVAIRTGDVDRLLSLLAPNVVAIGDGGGRAPAARRPIEDADRVAHALAMLSKTDGVSLHTVWVNGAPAIRLDLGGEVVGVASVRVDDGRITGIYAITNPEKLTGFDHETRLAR